MSVTQNIHVKKNTFKLLYKWCLKYIKINHHEIIIKVIALNWFIRFHNRISVTQNIDVRITQFIIQITLKKKNQPAKLPMK